MGAFTAKTRLQIPSGTLIKNQLDAQGLPCIHGCKMAENLIRFIRLNEGKLGRKRREREFEKLTDDEVASIEAIVQDAFEGFEN